MTDRSGRLGDLPPAVRLLRPVFELGGDLEQLELDRGIGAAGGELVEAQDLPAVKRARAVCGNHASAPEEMGQRDCAPKPGVSKATVVTDAIMLDSRSPMFLKCSHA